mmetsp:Transcript_93985/g.235933  ORF Transcript_93985/g.235933 Transcript_93985/m.235933 type:complete len:234 (+) Transcript_93985:445-1146(+)
MCNCGGSPAIGETSLTIVVLTSRAPLKIPHSMTMLSKMPTKHGGRMFAGFTVDFVPGTLMTGTFGRNWMTDITTTMWTNISHVSLSANVYQSALPEAPKFTGTQPTAVPCVSRAPVPSKLPFGFRNVSSCEDPMTIAKALKNPRKALWLIILAPSARRRTPQTTCMTPHQNIVKNTNSRRSQRHLSLKGPSSDMMTRTTTAKAPAQPETIPGRPPMTLAIIPKKKVPYRPCRG